MVVILILPSSNEQPHQHQPQHQQHQQQTPPPTSSISINGCDPFRLNEAARIISNSSNSNINNSVPQQHEQQQQQQYHHDYHNRKRRSAPKRITFQTDLINHRSAPSPSDGVPSAAAYTATTTATTSKKDRVRHITRVNISDVYSQIEIDGDVEPVTKEGKQPNPTHNINLCYY